MIAAGTFVVQLEVFGEALATEYLTTADSGDGLYYFLIISTKWAHLPGKKKSECRMGRNDMKICTTRAHM